MTTDASKPAELQQKLIELETKMARRSGFRRGFAMGIVSIVLFGVVISGILYLKRDVIVPWVVNTFMIGYVEEVFAGFPDAYMTYNRDRVLETLDNFTNAVAAKKVQRHDFAKIGRLVFAVLKDKRITYDEMEKILTALNKAAQVK